MLKTLLFFFFFFFFLLSTSSLHAESNGGVSNHGSLITRDRRKTVTLTESGQISVAEIYDGLERVYHLHFITLEPNSLFLPVMLQQDMVFYVHTGKGRLGWVKEGDMKHMEIESGDIYRLHVGSVFYLHSKPDPMGAKLRLFAIFINTDNQEPFAREYCRIANMISGFDEKILQAAFKVPDEILEEITKIDKPEPIVPMREKETNSMDWKEGIIGALAAVGTTNNKGKKPFNIRKKKPDFKNNLGWSLEVNSRDIHALKGSNMGVFMVNLTQGSIMGPHWNPRATEIAIVTHGQGMVVIVCPKEASGCKNSRFKVHEGDVFVVPRFHPMAQISFSNDSLAFMGFSTMPRRNYPQFLAGKRSVLRTIDERILAMSFGVLESTLKAFLDSQKDEIILACTFCAEEEEVKMEEEIEKQRKEEEEKEREEQEARKREEEARKREEEEQAKRREEEEAKRREEEEEKRREEEEAKRREEEEEKRSEEEEAKRREEEEEKRREEEEKRREEEEAKRREEEEEKRREVEEAQKREEEEEEWRREKEEEARKREEEEEEAQRREEEEEARKREEEEEEAQRREEEEEARKREEEEEEERRREKEEEARKREEEAEAEEARWREKEEEARKREEEEEEERERKAKEREEEEEEKAIHKREEEAREREEEAKREEPGRRWE